MQWESTADTIDKYLITCSILEKTGPSQCAVCLLIPEYSRSSNNVSSFHCNVNEMS